ncbi:ABC transporter permease [Tunicatimonas pelagia]|uniref:ABC transporter permease n=1 Tax=Tunicatimonas pelagia TaxID=931531 RepID=UPI002667139F|nr:ABC transporter permease [Tunicatimonas pelagia]WKN45795.1 ABC transporter permease [Tunicatimonas pelagia]
MEVPPPKYAHRFLRWFCRDDYLEEIEGNLLEMYERQYEDSPEKAQRQYGWNVLRHFRPAFIRSFKVYQPNNYRAMLRHNLILTFRSFQRYKSTFLINLIGLSSGLACALLIFLWVQDELRVDKFHANNDQLYQILEQREQAGKLVLFRTTAAPTAEALAADLPEVTHATTVYNSSSSVLSVDEKDITAKGQFVGNDFFRMFSFDLVQGDAAQVLTDPSSIVISKELAQRLFGTTEEAVGKTIERKSDHSYQVSGVFRNVPRNSSMQFDFVLPFAGYQREHEWTSEWSRTSPATYVQLKPGADLASFNNKIANFVRDKTEGQIFHRTMFAQRYSDVYLYSNYENGEQSGGRITYVRLFSWVAVFILLIACINFMNLSTARASRQMKEIGVKKAVGARRGSLASRYLSESVSVATISLLLAVLLVSLLLPSFNEITGKQLTFAFDVNLILIAIGITLFTGLVAGSYPALYLSGFDPAVILKNKLNRSVGEQWTRQGLVVLQFTLSIILITAVWVVYQQVAFVQNTHLGYDKDNVLYFERLSWEEGNLKAFLGEAEKIPGVTQISSIGHDMTGHNSGTTGLQWTGRNPSDRTEFEVVRANYGTLELLDIKLKEGRTFSESFSTDTAKIIFNEAAIDYMGLTDPVGEEVELWGENREIIGVVQDFHFESLHENIKPLFIILNPNSTWNIAAKIEAGQEQETIEQLSQLSKKFYPDYPFDYWFLDQEYQALYAAEQRVAVLSKYFAGIAILISCLGLFGLAAFTAERRLKEIGIRKALGASATSIVQLLTSDFTKMVLVAITIALPISYFAAQRWLQNFAFSISLQWWYFVGAGVLVLLIAWLTVGFQTVKAAQANPVECLQDE